MSRLSHKECRNHLIQGPVLVSLANLSYSSNLLLRLLLCRRQRPLRRRLGVGRVGGVAAAVAAEAYLALADGAHLLVLRQPRVDAARVVGCRKIIYLFIYLSIYLSVYLSICSSFHISI